tara:strand:- start:14242 stop:14529 length:288 start_codon:yes stop_codon:yes gene_type:complete
MNSFIPHQLNGVPVTIQEPINCEISVDRTWKERLFTLPFKPLVKTKIKQELKDVLEDGQILKMSHGLVMNAKTWRDCELALKNKDNETKFNAFNS